MKGLWIQLPVLDHNFYYLDSNIPLAAGYTLLYNREFLDENEISVEILPQHISSLASDSFLVNYILKGGYDFLLFTCYMWNVERSISIAKMVKEKKNLKTVFGGPEISLDSPWYGENAINTFFIGEGEEAFREIFLNDFPEILFSKPAEVKAFVSDPYSEGIISEGCGKNFSLETMRGCPYRCKYCFYSKNRSKVRFFRELVIEGFFNFLLNFKGAKEVYLLDPSFEVRRDMASFLESIISLNRNGIPLHTEIRADRVSEEVVDLMYSANFKSVEVGLQSISKRVLGEIDRKTDIGKFLRGVNLFRRRGIEPQIGIIMGLPHDTPESFYETLMWLKENDLHLNSEAFILSVLPQTKLREIAIERNYLFFERPPYYVLKTESMDEGDIFSCIEVLEREFGIEYYPFEMPFLLKNGHGDFIGNISLYSTDIFLRDMDLISKRVASVLTIEIKKLTANERKNFLKIVEGLFRRNPHQLLNLVFCEGVYLERRFLENILKEVSQIDNYYERLNYFRRDFTHVFSLRLHLKGKFTTFKKFKDILRYFSGLIYVGDEELDKIKETGDMLSSLENYLFLDLVRDYPLSDLKKIEDLIPGYFDAVIFEDIKILEKWDAFSEISNKNILKKLSNYSV